MNHGFISMTVRRICLSFGAALFQLACSQTPQAQFPDAEALLDRLESSTSCSRALRAEATLNFRGDGRRLAGKVLYQVQAPDRIRFDIFSPFGVTLSTLASDGRVFSLYSIEEKSFLYGPAKSCNIQRFTQVPGPTQAFVEILRGRAPVLVHNPVEAQLAFRRPFLERGFYEVNIQSKHGAEERLQIGIPAEQYGLPMNEQRPQLLGVSVSQNKRELYRVSISDYRLQNQATAHAPQLIDEDSLGDLVSSAPVSGPTCDAELPGNIRIYVPSTDYSLELNNIEVSHNPPLGKAAFFQTQPAAIVPVFSDCP